MNLYNDIEKEKICDLIWAWMEYHDWPSGEGVMQVDKCTIDAIELVSDLADVCELEEDDYMDETNIE